MYKVSWILLGFCLVVSNPLYAQSGSGEIYLQKGMQYFNNRDYQSAISSLEQSLKADSLQKKAYVLLAASYQNSDMSDLSEYSANLGLHYFPANASLIWIKASALYSQRRLNEALDVYEKLIGKKGESDIYDQKMLNKRLHNLYLQKAQKANDANKWDEVETYLYKARRYDTLSLNAERGLVLAYLNQKRWEDAQNLTDSLLKDHPKDIALHRMKASALYKLNKADETLKEYQILYKLESDNPKIGVIYAELLASSHKMNEANAVYDSLLQKFPKNKDIYSSLIKLNEHYGSFKREMIVLRKMQKQFPDNASVYQKIADTYKQSGKNEAERAVYDTLVTLSGDTVKYGIKKALSYNRDEKFLESTQLLRSLTSVEPDNVQLLRIEAKTEEQAGQWQEALATYRKLRKIQLVADVYYHLGNVFEHIDQKDSSLVNYRKAIDLGSTNPDAFYRLAVLVHPGNVNKSFELTRKALVISLHKIEEEQKKFKQQFAGSVNLDSLAREYKQKQEPDTTNELAESVFHYFTTNFDKTKVDPVLQKLLHRYNGSAVLYYLAGDHEYKSGNEKKALELTKLAVRWAPKLIEANKLLGKIYFEQGTYEKAALTYAKIEGLSPADESAYRMSIKIAEKSGMLDNLCRRWNSFYRTHPNNTILRSFLIEALQKSSRFADAEKIINDTTGN